MVQSLCKNCLKRQQIASRLMYSEPACWSRNMFAVMWMVESNLHTAVPARMPAKAQRDTKSKQTAHADYTFLPLRGTQQVYMLDKTVAGQISEAVRKHQSDPDVPLLESNPGPGLVTRKLLLAGLKKVVAVESLEGFLPHLKKLQKEVGARVLSVFHMQHATFTQLPQWNPEIVGEEPQGSLASIIAQGNRTGGPPLTVLNTVPHLREGVFFKCLLDSWTSQQGLFTLGQPEWFLFVSPQFYKSLLVAAMDENRPTKKFSNLAVVLHLLFYIHKCTEVPGDMFTPIFPRRQSVARVKMPKETSDEMRYLVLFRPLTDPLLTSMEIPAFFGFVKQVLQKTRDRLIPKMEQLIPGCGIHLIILGITMMTKTGDLSITTLVDIFKAMQMWPEYEGSPMKQYLSDKVMVPHEDELSSDF